MRAFISVRLASLDALIVTAAGVALAAPFVRHGLENGVSAASVITAESAYARLDRALAETESARDEVVRANAEMQTIQIAFADLLNLADERTEGRMRELIE